MNIATILVIYITIYIFLVSKDRNFDMFLEMIWLSTFTNLGSFFNNIALESFTREYFVAMVLIVSLFSNGKVRFCKRKLMLSLTLFIAVILGFANLLINPMKAFIAPMGITYDEILINGKSLQEAVFGRSNIAALLSFIVFMVVLLLCQKYLNTYDYINKIINFIEKNCIIFFVFIICEAIIINVFDIDNFRKLVMYVFGAPESAKIYSTSTVRFFGLKSAFGFYSEPSYVTGPLLVFYLINYIKGNVSIKKVYLFIISFFVAIFSGSTNGFIVMCFGIAVLIKIILVDKGISISKRIMFTVLCSVFGLIVLGAILRNTELWVQVVNKVSEKIIAYATQTKTSDKTTISGYVRVYGNIVCYNVLKTNPILGVGLGTTRGYGMVPSIVAIYGLLGGFILIIFYKVQFNIMIKKETLLPFIVLIGMLTAMYSSTHTYSLILVSLFISFNQKLEKTTA